MASAQLKVSFKPNNERSKLNSPAISRKVCVGDGHNGEESDSVESKQLCGVHRDISIASVASITAMLDVVLSANKCTMI